MINQNENYWPTDFGVEPEITPLTILQEQAAFLGTRTKNLVEGRVETAVGPGFEFMHSLYLAVPTLGSYRYFLLSVRHTPPMNTIQIFDATGDISASAKGLDEFKEKLKDILSSDRVRKIIGTLLSYARSPTSP